METAKPPTPRTFVPSLAAAAPTITILPEMLFLLRSLQQSTLSITLFIALYFIYWHYTLVDSIPLGLIAFIFTTSITQLTSHILQLSHSLYPTTTSSAPLKTTLITTSLLTIGYVSLFNSIGGFGGGDDWFKPIRENKGYSSLMPAGVEEHHAVLRRCLLGFGGVGVLAGWVFSVVALSEGRFGMCSFVMPDLRMWNRGGYKVLGSGEEMEFDRDEDEEMGLEEGNLKSL